MRVEKTFVAVGKGGLVYISKIVGTPTEKGSGWHLEIQKQLSGGGFEAVKTGDFAGLWHAKKAMETWRKGLRWVASN